MNKYENNKTNDRKREVKTYTDYDIFQGKIRLIQEGSAPIVIERDAAIEKAKAAGMNLVQISYNKNDFPHAVCKILDYGKFLYEQKQKIKNAKKKAKAALQDLKEISFTIRIDDGDKNTKINHVKKFLSENCKVKLSVQFSKREMNMLSFGKDLLKDVLAKLDGLYEFDTMPKAENCTLSCIIKPKK